MSLLATFREFLVQHNLQQEASLAVAFSGGVDSHVLLHLCYQLKAEFPHFAVKAFHVNHGISANADAWEKHCSDVCKQLQIPFQSTKLQISKSKRTSLEAKARAGRYTAWHKC